MNIQSLTTLSLQKRITLIALLGMLLVAVTMAIADRLTYRAAEVRFNHAQLQTQNMLWQRILKDQFEQNALGMASLRRERFISKALVENDKAQLQERADNLYNNLLASEILQHMQITNKHAEVVYRTDGIEYAGKSRMAVIAQTLASSKVVSDIGTDANGDINTITSFPLFTNGELIGSGVFIQSLRPAVEALINKDRDDAKRTDPSNLLEAFVIRADGEPQYTSNKELYNAFNEKFKNLDTKSIQYLHAADKVYTVSLSPLFTADNVRLGNLIVARDTTTQYMANQNAQWLAYSLIALGILVTAAFLLIYIRRSFHPMVNLLATVRNLHAGDIDARASISRMDEIGRLSSAFNDMADNMAEVINHEREGKEDLEERINILLEVVQKVSDGDLSAEMMVFSGTDEIDQLARGIGNMINSLNQLVSQVQQAGIQVTSSATEIAATANQQQATVTEQAAATQQIMATATEISATSRELASTMREVAGVADQTAHSATDGQQALTSMESTMRLMSEATASITSKLAVLSEKAANINTVVTTITKVADQTNLLSLNAAIEAEKAGEYGLGFSVVATEIRRLADQTAVATWDIEQMVKEMQSAVSAGVMGMDKFSEEVTRGVQDVQQISGQLARIIDDVQTLTPRFETVNEGMQSQSLGAQQISEGMVQLNEAAQQTVESLRQSSASIDTLKNAAHDLQKGVSKFNTSPHRA
ncbi:methyl-accepting chemotaxis protein [Sulfuriflexus sp.]|uniref:methyl-accepting chemotaxis protein n=1 Tax=Sulfuriflexus sp. TaxID=2015443 RepID=UPI0028CD84A8|nr:methyl-accepting chemotaxis protein [Sulfuriflexus sp.]MDT8403816.1 methyl-accepting chemotaxis protein [Sulfuriflexus sp.]